MNKDVEKILADFRESIQAELEAGMSESDLKEKVLALILLLFALGSGYETSEYISGEDREWLDEMYKMTVASTAGIIARASSGADMEATAIKLSNHAKGAYSYSIIVNGGEDEEMMKWELGETEHCGDCFAYAAMGAQPRSYWTMIATERNHYPQSPHLECKGLHCQCNMVGDDGDQEN